jgi:hypothetical protein
MNYRHSRKNYDSDEKWLKNAFIEALVGATDVVRVAPSVFSLDYSDPIIQKPD